MAPSEHASTPLEGEKLFFERFLPFIVTQNNRNLAPRRKSQHLVGTFLAPPLLAVSVEMIAHVFKQSVNQGTQLEIIAKTVLRQCTVIYGQKRLSSDNKTII